MQGWPGLALIAFLLFLYVTAGPGGGTTDAVAADPEAGVIDLNGEWNFVSQNGSIKGTGNVPGDIFVDLQNAKVIDDPLFGFNDVNTRWASKTQWNYTRTFDLTSVPDRAILEFDGLDTIATVFVNGQKVLYADNQFVQFRVDVAKNVKQGSNDLVIVFDSPVLVAEAQANQFKANYSHVIWPECPPDMYHGECHANMIRKIQASFSWDWGPAFPTVGVWRPARLIVTNSPRISSLEATVDWINDKFVVKVDVRVDNAVAGTRVAVQLGLNQPVAKAADASTGVAHAEFPVEKTSVELWWPNGHGNQVLYNLTASIPGAAKKTVKVGFRKVELIQDFVNDQKPEWGRHFYFKVNDIPIFLKGSNWIPVATFPAQESNNRRYKFLMLSSKEAGINAMRVWGGGRYEEDIFYDLADEYGILIWEDLMFACSLYPAYPDYLESVKKELTYNVNRLKHHPSMLLWAGNNENELGLHDGWFSGASRDVMKAEYLKLYKETAETLITQLDPGRPYVMSSPSEGIKGIQEGGISSNPNSENFGDIHFYNEFTNLWLDANYRTPRCATEYGVQSFPSTYTLSRAMPEGEMKYTGQHIMHRQHHPGGTENQLAMIFSHFPIPKQCQNQTLKIRDVKTCPYAQSQPFMDRFNFYSQSHQSIAYKVQTEHYRRMMGQIAGDGKGNTMCALYWQLNDIWAAPTWASIDTNLRWKMVHYEVRRFFQPVHVIIYMNGDLLQAAIVNDEHEDQAGTVEIQMLAWDSNFEPVYAWSQNTTVAKGKSMALTLNGKLSQPQANVIDYVFVARWKQGGNTVGYDSVVIPNELFKIELTRYGTVRIASVSSDSNDNTRYKISLEASGISPLTWITVNKDFLGWFSDNAFTMTEKKKEITLTLVEPLELSSADFSVCSLANCGIDVPFN
ncbi:unnamed protein product, partial [Mesorhabditis spiculigera]